MMNTMSVGIVAMLDPVMIISQSVWNSPDSDASPTGTVYRSGLVVTMSGHRNAVQLPRNVKIASADSAGVTSGSATCQKILNSPNPSTRAASINSSGTPRKNWRIKNTPKPVIIPGNMMPQMVSSHPIVFAMTYQGMTSISVGIMRVERMATNTMPRPLNRNLASVYPTRLSKNRTESVVAVATVNDTRNQRPNGLCPRTDA